MLRRILVSLMLAGILVGGGLGLAVLLVRTAPHPPTVDLPAPTLLVEAVRLEPRDVVEPIVGFGTARADKAGWVAAQVSGQIVELGPRLKEGALVESGELLIRIDPRDYQQQVARAESVLAADDAQLAQLEIERANLAKLVEIAGSELEITQRNYRRVLDLFEKGEAPQRELDLARQAVETARQGLQGLLNQRALLPQRRAALEAQRRRHAAELELARLNLQRCEVRAPFGGRVQQVAVELGELVSPGTRVCALLDPDLIEVPIELPVSLRDRVRPEAVCHLRLGSNPQVVWEGRVARIAPAADQATRTFSLYVEVDNTRQRVPLMPGVFVEATVAGPLHRDVLVVPRGAIDGKHVFVYVDGRASKRTVRIERNLRDESIVAGLRPGEIVITSNLDALYEGASVRLKDQRPSASLAAEKSAVSSPASGADVPAPRP